MAYLVSDLRARSEAKRAFGLGKKREGPVQACLMWLFLESVLKLKHCLLAYLREEGEGKLRPHESILHVLARRSMSSM